jgi:hypothetical protein
MCSILACFGKQKQLLAIIAQILVRTKTYLVPIFLPSLFGKVFEIGKLQFST